MPEGTAGSTQGTAGSTQGGEAIEEQGTGTMKKEETTSGGLVDGDARDEPEPLTRPEVISHARDPPRRLKASEVSLQGEAESAPQARNFQQNECRLRAENGP